MRIPLVFEVPDEVLDEIKRDIIVDGQGPVEEISKSSPRSLARHVVKRLDDDRITVHVCTDYMLCRWRANRGFLRDPWCNRDAKSCNLEECPDPEPRRMGE